MLAKWVPWLGERIPGSMYGWGKWTDSFKVQRSSHFNVCVCVTCICLFYYAYMISTKCVSKDAHVHSC